MKATIYLSLPDVQNPVHIARQCARACVSLNQCANVVPMFSSLPHKAKPTTMETGAMITLPCLKANESHYVLKLFGRLRDMFSDLHCVYLSIDGEFYNGGKPEFTTSYNGCILDWPYYLNRHINIGHGKPLRCSDND